MELTIEQALQQGVAAHKEGKVQDAERLYRAILQSQPLHPDANHNLGVLAVSVNKADVALPLFKAALEANPKIEQFWLSYIDALIKEQQFENAKQLLEQAKKQGVAGEKLNVLETQLTPTTQINEPKSASQKKSLTSSEKRKKLAENKKKKVKKQNLKGINPSEAEINNLLQQYQNGRYGDAEKLALSITERFPEHLFAWKILGAVFSQTGKVSDAINAKKRAVQLAPHDAEAHSNLGNTLQELDRLDEAEASYTQAIALKPNYAEARSNLGYTLHELGRLDEAEASYRQAISLKPDFAEAHNNLGNTLKELGRLDEAEASYRQAIVLKMGFFQAHKNIANILREQGRDEQAMESDRCAIFFSPAHAEETEPEIGSENLSFKTPSPIEYPGLYRAGMGTENVGGFLRAMALMLRPKNILEIGAGFTTPFLLEALVNNERVFDDGNLKESYFKNYTYDSKLVVIDNMSLGQLTEKPGMKDIIASKYTEFIEGSFEGKGKLLQKKFGNFDFVWFDCGGADEYLKFIDEYWDICSGYIFFHFTYSNGSPNSLHDIILNNVTGNPLIFDIVEPHKSRQGSITMVRKNDFI